MPPAAPSFRHEKRLGARVAGIDEAGRGPLAGPVVAAAVWIHKPRKLPKGFHDSKLLSAETRLNLFDALHAAEVAHIGVGEASVEEIDRINILHATMLAMHRAMEALLATTGPLDAALIDGNRCPKPFPCAAHPLIKGDQLSTSIAVASIVAKVTRDRMMQALHAEHPHYGWDANAGYGTPIHRAALQLHGATPHHRRSFAPVAEVLARSA